MTKLRDPDLFDDACGAFGMLRLEQLPDRSANLAQARADQMEARAARAQLERSLIGTARRLQFVSHDLGSWHDRALYAAGLREFPE